MPYTELFRTLQGHICIEWSVFLSSDRLFTIFEKILCKGQCFRVSATMKTIDHIGYANKHFIKDKESIRILYGYTWILYYNRCRTRTYIAKCNNHFCFIKALIKHLSSHYSNVISYPFYFHFYSCPLSLGFPKYKMYIQYVLFCPFGKLRIIQEAVSCQELIYFHEWISMAQ